jgi:hypothetical protein
MSTTTLIIGQISAFQTLISAGISALIAVLLFWGKAWMDKKNSHQKFIIDNGYKIHERLRDNLKGFLRDELHNVLSLPSKVSQEDRSKLKISYETYKKESQSKVFSNFNEVSLYQEEFLKFEKLLLKDIVKVSKLSIPRVQKVASKIEEVYDNTKFQEEFLNDTFHDAFMYNFRDIDNPFNETEQGYITFIQESHKKIFWIEVQKLLLKLEKEIERVVKFHL